MGIYEDNQAAIEEVQVSSIHDDTRDPEVKHKAKFGHELLAASATGWAMREFEKHRKDKNGQHIPENAGHEAIKVALAGLVGGVADRLIETKGEDAYDNYEEKRKTKKYAEERIKLAYDEKNGDQS